MSTDHAQLLAGKVAVVTGSSRGIGLAVAHALAAEGARVVLNGRDAATAERAAAQVGGGAVAVPGSAADHAVAAQLVDTAVAVHGGLDVLVNCAGAAEPAGSSILDISPADWQELLDSHLTSTFATCRAAAPVLRERGGGVIVNTSSHAFTGMYGGTGYAAGKGGVNSLTLALARELREHGIRVNAVCPGARTRLSTGDDYTQHVQRLHQRGLLDEVTLAASLAPAPPEYVAPLYTYLASDLSAGVSGEVLSAAGCYLGRFAPPAETLLGWRDHSDSPPWTPAEVAAQLATAGLGD
ncbi:SDR family oxidoreductase [Rhodococcus sp. X156]|uniref:SDR family NAD(P)-dependent oxidoreductase n=1 Tax=Rhodococcus sp. X156 TaxID=2499145 RepID=UPI000FDB0299|nr:SDR family oxidoreductase [Rhodococcus sp. X156]